MIKIRHIQSLLAGLLTAAIVLSPFFALATSIPKPVALFETSLASSISASDTSLSLSSATDMDGNVLGTDTYAFIIDEGTSIEEFVLGTCTGTSCTGLTRGVSVTTGTSTVTSLKKAHRRGASVKITDAPILLTLSRILNGQGTIPNNIRYDQYSTTSMEFSSTTLAAVKYVENIAAHASSSAVAYAAALDSANVKISGTQTITGDKVFSASTTLAAPVNIIATSTHYGSSTFSLPVVAPVTPYADAHLANKAYVDATVGAGAADADTTTKGVSEEATAAEVAAGTTVGGTSARLFVNPSSLAGTTVTASSSAGAADANKIVRLNSSGVLSSTLFGAPITTAPAVQVYTASTTWNKPANLKYVVVEVVGPGGGGAGGHDSDAGTKGAGGGAGGYCKKLIAAASLGSTETVVVHSGGAAGGNSAAGSAGAGTSSFGTHCTAGPGTGGTDEGGAGGTGGAAASGDINVDGGTGGQAPSSSGDPGPSGYGGSSVLGIGGAAVNGNNAGKQGTGYGSGGSGGGHNSSGGQSGGVGSDGVVIVTEYFI